MKVQELINQLQRDYTPDTELYVEYWDKNLVDTWLAKRQYTDFGEFAKQIAESVDYQVDHNPEVASALEKISEYKAGTLSDEEWAAVVKHMENYSEHDHMVMAAESLIEMAEHVIEGCDESDES